MNRGRGLVTLCVAIAIVVALAAGSWLAFERIAKRPSSPERNESVSYTPAADKQPTQAADAAARPLPDPNEGTPLSPTEQTVQKALNALSPDTGIKRLEACLAGLKELGAASRVYWALGTLYGQLDPPDLEKATGALRTATQRAQTARDRHQAALSLANLFAQKGDRAQAAAEVRAALERDKIATPPGLQLEILLGKLYEDDAANEAAEAAYKNAVDDAAAAGKPAANIYRQACLSLARFYRKLGRDTDADALARAMKVQLEGAKTEPATTGGTGAASEAP